MQGQGVKDRIVAAAWELFHEKGFGKTTVDDIIEKSGTSKGSFYHYFSSKDELLDTLSLILDFYYQELEERMDEEKNSIDQLLFLNHESHRMMEEKMDVELLASLYSAQLLAPGQRKFLDRNRKYYKMLQKIIENGQKKREIRTDMSTGEILKYYAMCERALVYDWCLNRGAYSLSRYSKESMCLMLESMRMQ